MTTIIRNGTMLAGLIELKRINSNGKIENSLQMRKVLLEIKEMFEEQRLEMREMKRAINKMSEKAIDYIKYLEEEKVNEMKIEVIVVDEKKEASEATSGALQVASCGDKHVATSGALHMATKSGQIMYHDKNDDPEKRENVITELLNTNSVKIDDCEDEEDEVKDNWEDEDEEKKMEESKVAVPTKSIKKSLEDIIAKKEKLEKVQGKRLKEIEENEKISPEERLKLQRDSDLQVTLEMAFGGSQSASTIGSNTSIDAMNLMIKDFEEFANAIGTKVQLFSESTISPVKIVTDRSVSLVFVSGDTKSGDYVNIGIAVMKKTKCILYF